MLIPLYSNISYGRDIVKKILFRSIGYNNFFIGVEAVLGTIIYTTQISRA